MPKKLRKMLGDVNAPSCVALRELIDTQSKDTIMKWVVVYTANQVLHIFENHCPDDDRPRKAVDAAIEVVNGKLKPSAVKAVIKECQDVSRELDHNPIAQAAARAIYCGTAVVQTLTHSLGLFFYAAAAIAYDRVGLEATDDEYAAIAEEVCQVYTSALRSIAVENEPNPVKLKWNC